MDYFWVAMVAEACAAIVVLAEYTRSRRKISGLWDRWARTRRRRANWLVLFLAQTLAYCAVVVYAFDYRSIPMVLALLAVTTSAAAWPAALRDHRVRPVIVNLRCTAALSSALTAVIIAEGHNLLYVIPAIIIFFQYAIGDAVLWAQWFTADF